MKGRRVSALREGQRRSPRRPSRNGARHAASTVFFPLFFPFEFPFLHRIHLPDEKNAAPSNRRRRKEAASALPARDESGGAAATSSSRPHFGVLIRRSQSEERSDSSRVPCPGAPGEDLSPPPPQDSSPFLLSFPFESQRSGGARTAALQNPKLERSVPVCSAAPHYPCFVRETCPEVVVPPHRCLRCAGCNPRTLTWEWKHGERRRLPSLPTTHTHTQSGSH